MAQTGEHSYIAEVQIYVRLVNQGAPSSLFDWTASARDKYGNDVEVLQLFTPSVMAAGEAPFRSIEELKANPLQTGVGAVVPIGLRLDGSARALDAATLEVSFRDAWGKRFAIQPSSEVAIITKGLLLRY